MPYAFKLTALVDQALQRKDIRKGVDSPTADITLEQLRSDLFAQAPAIEAGAASVKLRFEQVEKELQEAKAKRAEGPELPGELTLAAGILALSFALAILVSAVLGIGAGLQQAWALTAWSTILTKSGYVWVSVVVILSVVFLRYAFWSFIDRPRLQRKLNAVDRTDELELAYQAAKSAVDTQLLSDVVKLATERINKVSSRFFQSRLVVNRPGKKGERETSGPGLGEILNPAFEINTRNRRALLELIQARTSANVGVAGPRGVGKSTLLISLCNLDIPHDNKTPIGVYTAAPVDYDARDFLLHLYASVCRRVLRAKGLEEDEPDALMAEMPGREGFRTDIIGRLLILLSAASLAAAFVLSPIVLETNRQHALAAAEEKAAAEAKLKPGAKPIQVRPPSTEEVGGDLLATMGIQPAIFSNLAVVCFAAGLILLFQDPQGVNVPLMNNLLVRLGIRRRQFRRVGLQSEPDALGAQALRALREIRFQRTYASGWNGALKLPVGVEMGRSLGVTLARTQQTLPELVAAFKTFLGLAADAYGRVIIGIDELDKLRSDEDAEAFLNEIKAVFDVRGCFFLVSVSESAISNFERRGLPFRDAFDSAFDDIHYVDYLDLEATRRLLARRVLNLPEPALALSYVLSGGLPREVIRVARSILGFAQAADTPPTIGEIAVGLLRAEVAAKRRAMGFLARDIDLDPDTTEFLARLAALEGFDPLWSMNQADLQISSPQAPLSKPGTKTSSETDIAARRRLWKLRRELDCFLYFVMTAAQLFSRATTEKAWGEIMASGNVMRLAHARQALELGPGLAIARIREVRAALGLEG